MSMIKINKGQDALLVVDVQNDFCPGGALAVHEGDKVVSIINYLVPHFSRFTPPATGTLKIMSHSPRGAAPGRRTVWLAPPGRNSIPTCSSTAPR